MLAPQWATHVKDAAGGQARDCEWRIASGWLRMRRCGQATAALGGAVESGRALPLGGAGATGTKGEEPAGGGRDGEGRREEGKQALDEGEELGITATQGSGRGAVVKSL